MLCFSGMPTLCRPLLQPDDDLLGDVSYDELGHIAINDSMESVRGHVPAPSTHDVMRRQAPGPAVALPSI
jgi:hypothetical protein